MAHSSAREYPWSRLDSDNLTGLEEMTEKALLSATKHRYGSNLIYTDVGDILVAVNPFRELPIYDEAWSTAYSCPDVSTLAPHIYRVAARAFNAMVQGKKDQVCVISGESGAGKTESAKFIMYQVMKMCRSAAGLGGELQEKITQLNPILEAFGNAKTAFNDNSSRFGKYIQLIFDPNGRIVGAGLEQYLLEKSRVCVQGEMERNFHIFYYLYAGLPEDKLKRLQLKDPTEHRYLSHYPNVVKDCNSETSKFAFESVVRSMLSVGFEEDEIVAVVALLAGIILIGDIEFRGADGGEDNARVKNRIMAKAVAQVLELESVGELCFALTTLRTETRGEKVDKKYTCTKAANVRDALAKALYARMFQWIVSRLNSHLQPFATLDQLNIGILDIFGFENYEHNSFEQFCINLANEQLQCYFNHQIFAMEKMELEKEGIDALEIRFTDNKPVLDLYLTRPIGLLSLLDEQCRGFNGTERAFVLRCKESFSSHANYLPHKGNALTFSIRHYAGDVKYVAEGFLEKNKDSLPDTLMDTVKSSSMRLVRTLFRRADGRGGSQLRRSTMRKSQRSMYRAMSKRKSAKSKGGNPKKLLTVSAHFRQNLDLLMERIFSASPHFVRCIKPNQQKKALKCNDEFMMKQLRYTGMLEAVRVRREGYAYRPYFSDFFNSYRGIAYRYTDIKIKGTVLACSDILTKAGIVGWRMGQSRVFLRYYHEDKLQLMLKDIDDKVILIQKTFRGYLARKRTKGIRDMRKNEKKYMIGLLNQISKHGKDHLPRLIEMNREDILSVNERFGQMRRKPTVSNSKSYEGLSVRERKLKKAKNIGVQLVPTFVAPSPPIDPIRRSVHNKKSASSTSSITNDTGANYTDRSTPEASMQLEEISSRDTGESYQRSHVASNIPTPVSRSGPSSGATNRSKRTNRSSAAVRTSYSTGALSQASVQYGQEGGQIKNRSETDTGNLAAVAAAVDMSQRQGTQRDANRDKNAKVPESSSPKVPSKPAKSGLFSRPKKKVSSHYEEILASKEKEKQKSTSRFRIKLPFGRGRVKELTAKIEPEKVEPPKIEPQPEKAEPPKRPPQPKLAKQSSSTSVSPKHYFPPPKEPAPPPPREPAPPPPTAGGSNVAPHNHRGTVSSRPSIESNIPTYRQGPVSSKSSVETSVPIPSYHRRTNDISPTGANVPSFYRRTQQQPASKPTTESHIPSSYHRKQPSSDSNIPPPRVPPPNKQYSPRHEDQPGPPPSKVPPPASKTYYRPAPPLLPVRTPKATPAEAAVVNSHMTLYKVQPYLVPIRTQPPPEVVFIPGPSPNEEERPPLESVNKVSPPPAELITEAQASQEVGTSSNAISSTRQTTDSNNLAATSNISKSNMSLDSIIDEYTGASPSPSVTQPPSEPAGQSSPKEKERRPSFMNPNSTSKPAAAATYRQLEHPSSKTQTSNQTSSYTTNKPIPTKTKSSIKQTKSKLPTHQSSTYTSRLPTPTSGGKPIATYQISTLSKKSTAAASTKPPPVSGSSMSLDSILTDMQNEKKGPAASSSNSAFRSQLPSATAASSSNLKREDRSSPSSKVATSAGPTSSLTNRNFSTEAAAIGNSSMSLDSILDEFLKMSDTSSGQTGGEGETQNLHLSTKDEEDTRTIPTPSHRKLKEREEKKKSPISEVQRRIDQPSLESAPRPANRRESKSSRQSQEVKRQESLLSQGSAASTSQRREVKDKAGASGGPHPTLQSRQLQIRKERINLGSAPTNRQLQSKEKPEPNSKLVYPQARKLSRQEDQQQTVVGLESSITYNGQPRVMKVGGGATRQLISEPKQLQRREELQSNPDLTSSLSMSQNLVKLKVRANSTGTVLDEDLEYADPRDARKPSDSSDLSNGRISPTPKADRRHVKRKKSKKNHLAIQPSTSLSSGSGDLGQGPTPSGSMMSLNGDDWDLVILGFYPHLNHNTVHEFIMGQPRGTYAIYKENLSDEPLNTSSNFGLAVSLGRSGIKQFSIICTKHDKDRVSYRLTNLSEDIEDSDSPDSHDGRSGYDIVTPAIINNSLSFPDLKALVEHYKRAELSTGLTLHQPRLMAGVYVVGLMKAVKKLQIPTPAPAPTPTPIYHSTYLTVALSSANNYSSVAKHKTGRFATRKR